jgi:hypothetical protein
MLSRARDQLDLPGITGPTAERATQCSAIGDDIDGSVVHLRAPGRNHDLRLTGAARQASEIQGAHGMELQLGFQPRQLNSESPAANAITKWVMDSASRGAKDVPRVQFIVHSANQQAEH